MFCLFPPSWWRYVPCTLLHRSHPARHTLVHPSFVTTQAPQKFRSHSQIKFNNVTVSETFNYAVNYAKNSSIRFRLRLTHCYLRSKNSYVLFVLTHGYCSISKSSMVVCMGEIKYFYKKKNCLESYYFL